MTDEELALSFEKLKESIVKQGLILLYSEYKESVEGKIYTDESERITDDLSTPEWFFMYQKRALNLIRKKIAQSHLIPRNRLDYLDLKPQMWVEEGTNITHSEAHDYQGLFRDGLSYQIKFMYEEEITFSNGWLNSTNSMNIGGYSQSQTPDKTVNKLFNNLHPFAYDSFETMGWMYAGLNHRLDWDDFYKGER